MQDINKRLDLIEQRLFAIEEKLDLAADPAAAVSEPAPPSPEPQRKPEVAVVERPADPPDLDAVRPAAKRSSMSSLMAVGAAISFLLAAAYFVLLAIEHGWLTPPRQLMIAAGFGLALIGAGAWLSGRDRLYAAYLPAAGIGILYLTVYAGHLFYNLIPTTAAFVCVAGVSLLAITLGRRFDNSVYTMLAAAGVYLTPILIKVEQADLIGIVIYFSAWSLLFSFLSLQEKRRSIYLVALYLALLCFDAAWRYAGAHDWSLAATYQLAQFVIFVVTAVMFSVIHQRPMDNSEALFHGLPLFYFYLLEYAILKRFAPDAVVVAGLASVVVVVGAFLVARSRIKDPSSMSSAATLVSTYSAVVTAHMVFGELLPEGFFAWGALVLPMLTFFVGRQLNWSGAVSKPILLVGSALFVAGFMQTMIFESGNAAPENANVLLVLYALALYTSYFLMRRDKSQNGLAPVVLYLGHLAAMVATVRWLDSAIAISLAWAVFAVALLLLALQLKDKNIGQSSMFVFAASALKVLIFDLADSGSTVRIVSLVILGASLYAGGWLYQNLVRDLDA